MKLTDDQIASLLTLVNREILANEKAGDEAYNTHWKNVKEALLHDVAFSRANV